MRYSLSFLLGLAIATTAIAVGPSRAATPLLIWPVDPVIGADRAAAALWLENRGEEPAMMQVRIFRWSQRDEGDRYENQQDVQPSPPVVTIPPGERQMIRLTAVSVPRPAGESAYRIVVDEIPTRSDKAVGGSGPDRNAFGIRLQMRYSIPLFVYGGPSDDEAGSGDKHGFNLRCTLLDRPDGKRVQVTNSGTAHARLVDVAFLVNGRDMPVAEGLLGYVLPGSSMSWPVPNGATGREPPTMAAPNGGRIAIAGCSGG